MTDGELLALKDDYGEDDALVFADEQSQVAEKWKVLIVDDDKAIHKITKKTLAGFTFEGKSLKFFSAYTRQEAERLIRENPDTAVVLLDVVIGDENAGLAVARYIRDELKNSFVRIVLRTGQPGEAPEETVIRDYDINDYKEKTELTARKLYTTMIASLRSYRDLMLIDNNKRGLEKILESSAALLEIQSMRKLASSILSQLVSILSLRSANGCASAPSFAALKEADGEFYVAAATGKYCKEMGRKVCEVVPASLLTLVRDLDKDRSSLRCSGYLLKYFKGKNGCESFVYLEGLKGLEEWEKNLIEIFSLNVSIAFDNLYLNKEIEDTQREIIFTLGEFSEARSKETGNHVKRVAEYSKLLGIKYGLPEEEAEIIKMATPMHDVGKLGIADAILNKPGKLTAEEFEVIKAHGTLGYEILRNSNRKIMQAGAIIALQHHERYNGQGYPQGLKGEEIHIYGRITAIADVFDALGSDRVYKKAWPLEQILDYFRQERGEHFDPKLVDIFLENLPEFLHIREAFADK